jgi:hypothetical protein
LWPFAAPPLPLSPAWCFLVADLVMLEAGRSLPFSVVVGVGRAIQSQPL